MLTCESRAQLLLLVLRKEIWISIKQKKRKILNIAFIILVDFNLTDGLSVKHWIQTAKQKRKLQEKILKAKKITELDVENDAERWVEKMREKERERKLAEARVGLGVFTGA